LGRFCDRSNGIVNILNFYNITAGKYDELYMPGLGLVGAASAQLTFDVAIVNTVLKTINLK
jgi:hypothetical protein